LQRASEAAPERRLCPDAIDPHQDIHTMNRVSPSFLRRVGASVPSAALAALVAISSSQPAAAQHAGDILLSIEAGTILTGQIDAGGIWTSPVQVFTGEFGDSGFPTFTANPGFDCLVGTFQPGTKIGFNIIEPLQVWNGNGFEVAGSEFIEISFLTLAVQTGDAFVPGFELAVQPNGGFHRHYNMFLLSAAGQPQSDVYLLVREMYSTDPAVGASAPIYLLLNYGADVQSLLAAQAWLLAQLSPPACAADLDGDGEVGGADLGVLLAAWGTGDQLPDLDESGIVDGADLGVLLAAWGSCP